MKDYDTKLMNYLNDNYTELVEEFVEEHADLGILDDDYSDLGDNSLFQEWVEEKFNTEEIE